MKGLARASLERALRPRGPPAEGETMQTSAALDWTAIVADPRFQQLHAKKTRFLWGLMVFSIIYYFLLPIGAAYFQDIFKIKVWGPVNVGLLFALVGVRRGVGHRVLVFASAPTPSSTRWPPI